MNFGELKDEVYVLLADGSEEILTRIPDFINEVIGEAIEEANVPGFKAFGIVSTEIDQSYTSLLPDDFSGRIHKASQDGNVIEIKQNLEEIVSLYPGMDEVGADIFAICAEGLSLIYYQPIPTVSTDIVILYSRLVTTLVNNSDIPEVIPAALHREIIVCGAAAKGYNLLEDGLEEEKINTRSQTFNYNRGMSKLKNWSNRRTSHRSSSTWRN